MKASRNRPTYAALVVAESAWIFAAGGLLGVVFGLGGSPLSWPAGLVLLAISLMLASGLDSLAPPQRVAQAVLVIVGVVAIYLTMAVHLGQGAEIDLAWPTALAKGSSGATYITSAIVGLALATALWWRGTRLASVYSAADTLASSFKIGLVVLAAAAIVDISSSSDLNVALVAFPFFGASLVGLALSNLLPATQEAVQGRTWMRVVGGTVVGVLLLGILFSLFRGRFLSPFTSGIASFLSSMYDLLSYILLIPISYVAGFLISILMSILRWLTGGRVDQELLQQGQQGALDLRERTSENEIASLIGHAIVWFSVALLILAVLYLLARAFRQRWGLRGEGPEGSRESLWSEAQPGEDLGALLVGLLPDWLRKGRTGRPLRLPQGERGIVEVFRIYFRLLAMANARGSPRLAWQSPEEYRQTLETLFPDAPVQMATAAFNRACYGHHAATEQEIAYMNGALDHLARQDEYQHSRRKRVRELLFGKGRSASEEL